jgi:prepilin-type N-terminal cleavage/methylation domain-containing protein
MEVKMRVLKHGFTMIELLVVVAIIGVLAAVMLAGFNPLTQIKRARDSERKAQLKQIQNAFESYYAKNSYRYAACNTMASELKNGQVPTESYYTFTCDAVNNTYCLCAEMALGTGGNSNNTACTSWNNSQTGTFYCLGNLQ